VNGCVDAFFETPERGAGPNRLTQLLPRHDFSGALEQQRQDAKRLLLQVDPRPVPAQLAGAKIHFKRSKAKDCHERSSTHPLLTYRAPGSALPPDEVLV